MEPFVEIEGEEWRDIIEWEGMYQVSNKGRVRSVERDIVSKNGQVKHKKSSLVSVRPGSSGYCNVTLYKNNKEYNRSVHRLVAQAFIPNPGNLPEVDHIDTNRSNNNVDNLRWVSAKQNIAYQTRSYDTCLPREVYCIDTDEHFRSITAAGKSVNASAQQIIDSIKSKSCCKGKVFVYSDNLPQDIELYASEAHAKYQNFHPTPKMPTCKKVIIVETGQIFDSITDTSKYFNCDPGTIKHRIQSNKQFDGITLKFVSD